MVTRWVLTGSGATAASLIPRRPRYWGHVGVTVRSLARDCGASVMRPSTDRLGIWLARRGWISGRRDGRSSGPGAAEPGGCGTAKPAAKQAAALGRRGQRSGHRGADPQHVASADEF